MATIDFMTESTAQNILDNIKLANAYTKIYLEGLNIDSWAALVEISKSGQANKVMSVGDTITSTYTISGTDYTNTWIVMDFRDVELEDGTAYENVPIIQMQYTNSVSIEFDEAENTVATETTAEDGYYYFGYDGTNYTALNYSTGDTIDYSSYTYVYKTLWNSVNPIIFGLNNWKYSFARQYMNNSGTGWAVKQHDCDVLPSNAATITGFKSFMPSDMIAALHPIKITTKQCSYMGGGTDITYDMFWLPSISEMNMSNTNASADDGDPWEYYKELFESDSKVPNGVYTVMRRYAVNATASVQTWWTRSTYLGFVHEWFVSTSGGVTSHDPFNSHRLLPTCAII